MHVRKDNLFQVEGDAYNFNISTCHAIVKDEKRLRETFVIEKFNYLFNNKFN